MTGTRMREPDVLQRFLLDTAAEAAPGSAHLH